MLRERLVRRRAGEEGGFSWRGEDVSRLEGFSDAVFAFAVTLLVVSLEVPQTFDELLVAMRGFFAFAVCFALLFSVWRDHYKFFRRYGLRDAFTVYMNVLVGLVSVTVAAIGRQEAVNWAGMIYLLIFPLQMIHGRLMDSRRRGKTDLAGTAREEEGGGP